MQAFSLKQINELSKAGLLDLANALQFVLIRLSTPHESGNFFDQLDGDLGREVRDLVHHVLHDIPDDGVTTWLNESTPEELAGLERLLEHARAVGYRTDDLPDLNSNSG